MAPPLTLEFQNRIVHDTILAQLTTEGPEPIDVKIADFNQVVWTVKSDKTKITVSASCKCWATLKKWGGQQHLTATYGAMLQATPEPDMDATLTIPMPAAPMAPEAAEANASKAAQLARNLMAGPFNLMFENATKRTPSPGLVQIDYRPFESVWLKQEGDRVIVIFSIFFDDPDDVVIGRVFLSEIGKNLQGAPAADVHLKDPPKELAAIKGLRAHGYVSFLCEARHFAPKQRDQTINMLIQFRNYVHYHIKCSKAFLHIRMRNRVNLLLQVLNRAKQEVPKQDPGKKQISFVRK